eukprot:gene57340-biopygen103860
MPAMSSPWAAEDHSVLFVSALQMFAGISLNVIFFSAVSTKFQMPKADLVFSKCGLITSRDGRPCVQFRLANRRVNQLCHPELRLAAMRRHQTKEGEDFMQLTECETIQPQFIRGVYTVVHFIDPDSPLWGITPDGVDASEYCNVSFVLSLKSHDSVYCTGTCGHLAFRRG